MNSIDATSPTPADAAPQPPEPPESLTELLAKAAVGDQRAFSAVYDATAPLVFGLAMTVVGDRAEAEEVARATYVEVWRRSGHLDQGRHGALSWILTIAHRKAVDRARSVGSRGRHEVRRARDDSAERPGDLGIGAALARLGPGQRHALELAYFGGHTTAEVATLTEVSVSTANLLLRDGLIQLRDLRVSDP